MLYKGVFYRVGRSLDQQDCLASRRDKMSLELKAKTIFTVRTYGPFVYDHRNDPYAVRNEVQYFSRDSFAESGDSRSSTPGTVLAPPTQTYLQFTVDDPMKNDGMGFVFGNDPASSDVYAYGISPLSKQLFAITMNHNTGAPLIRNLTRRGINITSTSMKAGASCFVCH